MLCFICRVLGWVELDSHVYCSYNKWACQNGVERADSRGQISDDAAAGAVGIMLLSVAAASILDLDCGGKVVRDAAFSLRIENKAASRSTLPPHSKRHIRDGSLIANDICFINWPHWTREPQRTTQATGTGGRAGHLEPLAIDLVRSFRVYYDVSVPVI